MERSAPPPRREAETKGGRKVVSRLARVGNGAAFILVRFQVFRMTDNGHSGRNHVRMGIEGVKEYAKSVACIELPESYPRYPLVEAARSCPSVGASQGIQASKA
jgi:hypothetical protein